MTYERRAAVLAKAARLTGRMSSEVGAHALRAAHEVRRAVRVRGARLAAERPGAIAFERRAAAIDTGEPRHAVRDLPTGVALLALTDAAAAGLDAGGEQHHEPQEADDRRMTETPAATLAGAAA